MRSAPRASDGWWLGLGALLLRIGVVIWAAPRFPPAADGKFYHLLAQRIANGSGYTWLWPDGVVTYAAHYPVGYPAMMGGLYALFGSEPYTGMLANAALGGLAVVAVHRMIAHDASRLGAVLGASLVALHPSLVAYTPALMTEGVVAALLALWGWLAIAVRDARHVRRAVLFGSLGIGLGITVLIRPQAVLLAPAVGALAMSRPSDQGRAKWSLFGGALLASALSIAVCFPWISRNCSHMGRCVFVSANAGWNLLIGAGPGATGAWVPVEVAGLPRECEQVFAEAEKDRCFGRAGWRVVSQDPLRWVRLVPRKLSATFDHGAANGYLAESNPSALPPKAKFELGVLETLWQRVVLLLALAATMRMPGPRRMVRCTVGCLAGLGLLSRVAWPSYLALVVTTTLLGRSLLAQPQAALTGIVVGTTALTHAAFFGADRYAMICFCVLGHSQGLCCPRRHERTEHPVRAVFDHQRWQSILFWLWRRS